MIRYKTCDTYMKQEMNGETILFDPSTHNILSLNASAKEIYENLDGKTYDEVTSELQRKYQSNDLADDIKEEIDILISVGAIEEIEYDKN